jgi:hypothetical protein
MKYLIYLYLVIFLINLCDVMFYGFRNCNEMVIMLLLYLMFSYLSIIKEFLLRALIIFWLFLRVRFLIIFRVPSTIMILFTNFKKILTYNKLKLLNNIKEPYDITFVH